MDISISLFRVSADSQFLDMIFDCPEGYHFNFLELKVNSLNANGEFFARWYDLSDVLFAEPDEDEDELESSDDDDEEEEEYQTHWAVRLPLSKIEVDTPSIFEGTWKAIKDDDPTVIINSEGNVNAICSDVNNAYYYLLDNILLMADKCNGVSDEAIRDYLILYGHLAAIQLFDIDIAKVYFKILINKFDKCGNGKRPAAKHIGSSCNCGRR